MVAQPVVTSFRKRAQRIGQRLQHRLLPLKVTTNLCQLNLTHRGEMPKYLLLQSTACIALDEQAAE